MPFEALANTFSLDFSDVPPEWSPLFFPFDPDLPLFPLLYFHVLANDLDGQRPRFQDRAYGYIRSVRVDIGSRSLAAEIICNKDLNAPANAARFLEQVRLEVGHRLGVIDRVTIEDVLESFPEQSRFHSLVPVLREMWHHVADTGYGGRLPFGRLWDRVVGLARYFASFNSPSGGRKAEIIETHFFCTHFGERVAHSADVPAVEFHLCPTWEELVDISNPLALFPKFRDLVQASHAVCALVFFRPVDLGRWSYTGLVMPRGNRLDKTFYMDRFAAGVPQQHRMSLVNCFNSFNKGAPRATIFLMLLNDFRQITAPRPLPHGSNHPRLDPERLSGADVADIALNMQKYYQSKKVVAIYTQQCHGNVHSLPIDTWIGAFLAYPLNVASYDAAAGVSEKTAANRSSITALVSGAGRLGKVERLLWATAQARKIHSTICDDAFWCIKESEEFKARGANPLACKACHPAIRSVCPAHKSILDFIVSFNRSVRNADFDIVTSAGNNITPGQTFVRCVKRDGVIDEDTPTDRAEAFNQQFPVSGHVDGAPMTVHEFIERY